MTMASGTADLGTTAGIGMPRGARARPAPFAKLHETAPQAPPLSALREAEGADIRSGQALLLAAAASLLLTGLLRVVL